MAWWQGLTSFASKYGTEIAIVASAVGSYVQGDAARESSEEAQSRNVAENAKENAREEDRFIENKRTAFAGSQPQLEQGFQDVLATLEGLGGAGGSQLANQGQAFFESLTPSFFDAGQNLSDLQSGADLAEQQELLNVLQDAVMNNAVAKQQAIRESGRRREAEIAADNAKSVGLNEASSFEQGAIARSQADVSAQIAEALGQADIFAGQSDLELNQRNQNLQLQNLLQGGALTNAFGSAALTGPGIVSGFDDVISNALNKFRFNLPQPSRGGVTFDPILGNQAFAGAALSGLGNQLGDAANRQFQREENALDREAATDLFDLIKGTGRNSTDEIV